MGMDLIWQSPAYGLTLEILPQPISVPFSKLLTCNEEKPQGLLFIYLLKELYSTFPARAKVVYIALSFLF